jgi:hypothetical protein
VPLLEHGGRHDDTREFSTSRSDLTEHPAPTPRGGARVSGRLNDCIGPSTGICETKSAYVIPMTRQPHTPTGCWPLEMRAETAAAYCDEPSVDAFLAKVRQGIYSSPARLVGCLPKWHRFKLDQDIARRHGLPNNEILADEDVTELI